MSPRKPYQKPEMTWAPAGSPQYAALLGRLRAQEAAAAPSDPPPGPNPPAAPKEKSKQTPGE